MAHLEHVLSLHLEQLGRISPAAKRCSKCMKKKLENTLCSKCMSLTIESFCGLGPQNLRENNNTLVHVAALGGAATSTR